MRKETKELGIVVASDVRAILDGLTDPSLVTCFEQTRYESLKQTSSKVEIKFPSGSTLTLYLNEKDAAK